MKATVKTWIQKGTCDIGLYKTTVTLYGNVTVAVTLCGKHTRKEAIGRVFNHLVWENRWSPDFLRQVKALA